MPLSKTVSLCLDDSVDKVLLAMSADMLLSWTGDTVLLLDDCGRIEVQ